ncbi:MAG: hypothetical protein KDB80_07660 [Planctomycetes bacterium]|nr:hypothetical protein [Planctomycetota bacterium]
MTIDRYAYAATLLALFASCSSGGDETTPQSDVQISRTHHLVGIIGPLQMTEFPLVVDTGAGTLPLAGALQMSPDDSYSLTATSSVQVDDRYALDKTGALSLFVEIPNSPTLVYRGGYDVDGDTGRYFFTDRVSGRVGLYFGTPLIAGTPDPATFAGDWHVFAMNVLYATAGTLPSVHEVGRAVAGKLSVDAMGALTGSVFESVSPTAALPVSGDLSVFQEGAAHLNLTLGSKLRRFDGGGTTEMLALAQTDQANDGAGGVCALVRQRTTPVDLAQIAGVYDVGAWNLFLNPGNAGFDAAIGTVELTTAGDFVIQVRNNTGDSATYDGDFTAMDDGSLAFDVVQPTETWPGAVSEDYRTIVFVDNVATTVGGIRTAVRFFVAVRRSGS